MKKIAFKIMHNGKEWVIRNDLLSLSSPSLEELDAKVKDYLQKTGEIKTGDRLKVLMEFDNYSIPQWIRQYSQHYFDRIVEIEG